MSISKAITKRTNNLNKQIIFELEQRRENYLKNIRVNNPNMSVTEINRCYFTWMLTDENQNDYKLQKYREHLAAFQLQKYYFRAKLHIEYKFCRTRVNNFCDKVINKKI